MLFHFGINLFCSSQWSGGHEDEDGHGDDGHWAGHGDEHGGGKYGVSQRNGHWHDYVYGAEHGAGHVDGDWAETAN